MNVPVDLEGRGRDEWLKDYVENSVLKNIEDDGEHLQRTKLSLVDLLSTLAITTPGTGLQYED